MIRKFAVIVAVIFFILSTLPERPSAVTKKLVLGYYTNKPSSTISFQTNHKFMNQIATDTYKFDATGKVMGTAPKEILNLANSKQVQPYAVVSNYGKTDWDTALAHKILSNTEIRKKFIANLLSLLRANQYKGVNIDFEALSPKDRILFSKFIQAVSKKLSIAGYLTMVSVPAKIKDTLKDSWSGAYDFKTLGKCANYIQIMTYDETGYWWNLPGSVASLPWINASLKYAVTVINPKKVLMGIGAYGNDWNITSHKITENRRVPLSDIPQLLERTGATPIRDKNSASLHFRYKDQNGHTHEVWYDDATSISKKAQYTNKYKLGGISIFALGMEGPDFWGAINRGLQ